MKTLLIVESPAKAHHIQEYLGKDYIVMASKGHITELAKGGRHGMGIDIDKNFKPHYILMESSISILDQLIKAAKISDQILIASDPDREGEAIAWHLAQRLADTNKPIKRIVFGEIKKTAVVKAIKNPRDIDINLFHSQEARRILDRLVGFTASPFLMNFFGPRLSAGRVQSVVTRLVIDREREIEAFIPEEFWTIQVALSKEKKNPFITKFPGKLVTPELAEEMRVKLADKCDEYIVSEVISSEEKKLAPAPLITSSLQQAMSKAHGFDAEKTMKAAQTLYESGYCTYIRTDSVRVGDEALESVRQWITDNKLELPKKPNLFKNKDAAQDAHECIRPSDLSLDPKDNFAIIDPDEKLVYEMIWRSFIASQMMPAVYSTLKVTAHVKDDPSAEVKASGKTLVSKGYMEILGLNDNSKIEIPNLIKGDVLFLTGKNPVKVERKQTQPPPRYSLEKLIDKLVSKNIGRPATYADLLSKLTARNYVEKIGNVYHATDLGKKITDILKEFFTFMDYDFTASMEEDLDKIAAGKINHIDMLRKFYPEFKSEIDRAYINYGGTVCEKCGSQMATRTAKVGGEKFLACTGYPRCRNTKSIKTVS